jgi:hypothetical protein
MGELRTASLTGSKPGIWVACRSDSGPSSAAASEPVETPPVATGQCPPTISFFGLSAPFILILKAKARAPSALPLDANPQDDPPNPAPYNFVHPSQSPTASEIASPRFRVPHLFIIPLLSFSLPFPLNFSVIIFDPHLIIFCRNILPPLSHSGNARSLLVKYFFLPLRLSHTRVHPIFTNILPQALTTILGSTNRPWITLGRLFMDTRFY